MIDEYIYIQDTSKILLKKLMKVGRALLPT